MRLFPDTSRGGFACAATLLALSAGTACEEDRIVPGSAAAVHHAAVDDPRAGLLVYEQGRGDARDLFVVLAGGGEPRRLTTDDATDGLPRWSADGRSVTFTSNRTGGWQVWRVPAVGGEPVRVRANDHREWQADESPDGHRLAFLSNAGGAEWLWLLELGSGEARPLQNESL